MTQNFHGCNQNENWVVCGRNVTMDHSFQFETVAGFPTVLRNLEGQFAASHTYNLTRAPLRFYTLVTLDQVFSN